MTIPFEAAAGVIILADFLILMLVLIYPIFFFFGPKTIG